MKILRSILTHKSFSRFASWFMLLDAFTLCFQHRKESKAAMAALRQVTGSSAKHAVAAVDNVQILPNVERERARLLRRMDLLSDRGPYEQDWTVSAAAAISKSPKQAALIGALIREFAPQHVLELGTNVGISASYMASATSGMVITLEASSARMNLAREMHRNLGIGNVQYVEGYFNDTLHGLLNKIGFVDFCFIDGHHQYQPTINYFEAILPYAKPGTVFVFDDIRFSPEMWKAWNEISANGDFGLVLDFWTMGACVVCADSEPGHSIGPITCF